MLRKTVKLGELVPRLKERCNDISSQHPNIKPHMDTVNILINGLNEALVERPTITLKILTDAGERGNMENIRGAIDAFFRMGPDAITEIAHNMDIIKDTIILLLSDPEIMEIIKKIAAFIYFATKGKH